MERAHRDQLLETSVEACQAEQSGEGSRGRSISPANERIDSAPTWVLLDDLAERGFGIHWVSKELGYAGGRSEEHTSELQSLMRISYAVFCLKKKKDPRD